jgi:hypothetical protein
MVLKMQRVGAIINGHIEGSFPISAGEAITPPPENQSYVVGVMSQIYANGYQKMIEPKHNGSWNGNVFVPDMDSVPAKYNPEGRSFGQIIDVMEQKFGIHFTGIPFKDEIADFSGIAIAQIDMTEIVEAHYPNAVNDMNSVDFKTVFEDRAKNFDMADEIVASRQLPIPGLPKNYTAKELKKWREKNHFTWEESPHYGYLLVSAEIHNNIPHTGLVAIQTHSKELGRVK